MIDRHLIASPANPRKLRSEFKSQRKFDYNSLELRKVLSAYFPAYVNGQLSLGNPDAAAPYPLSQTFHLETNPTATKTIYLDFDGYHSVNDGWGHNIQFPAYSRDGNVNSFSNAELIEIQLMFQNVAEDFAPFNVNVTTRDPGVEALRRTSSNDNRWGVRAVSSQPTGGFGDNFGGIAYLNSFRSSSDVPVFIFNKGTNAGAQTISHEVGHALGLSHDGLGNSQYHPGSGSGETSWGPLLGAPFRANITQFSNGDYAGSTTRQDDLAIITSSANGISYRADDYGNSISAASALSINADSQVFDWGIIERNTDRDYLRFQTGAGNVSLSVDAFGGNPNLDILARIYDASGSLIATSNPATGVDASFNLNLDAGTYYLAVEGTGLSGRYSDYGSLGFYSVEGSVRTAQADAAIGEAGRVNNVNHGWKTVRFNNRYNEPVVVAGPASKAGSDPVTVRIRNVTANSFQIRIDEYEYLDGTHAGETVDYIVVEAGEYQLTDGTIIRAGNQNNQTNVWKRYSFGGSFESNSASPVLLTQLTTNNEGQSASTRVSSLNRDGFLLKIQEEEASNQRHGPETVSWIAIERGRGETNGNLFEAFAASGVTHDEYQLDFRSGFDRAPAFIAGIHTNQGGDTANLRYNTLSRARARVFVEEERSLDAEVFHVEETISYLAIERGDIVGSPVVQPTSNSIPVATQPALTTNSPSSFTDWSDWFDLFFSGSSTSFSAAPTTSADLDSALAELNSWPEIALESGHVGGDHHHDHDEAGLHFDDFFIDEPHDHFHGHGCNCEACTGVALDRFLEELQAFSIVEVDFDEGLIELFDDFSSSIAEIREEADELLGNAEEFVDDANRFINEIDLDGIVAEASQEIEEAGNEILQEIRDWF